MQNYTVQCFSEVLWDYTNWRSL